MKKSEEEAREACVEMVNSLINDHKKSISALEIMKGHINDMSSEQFERFAIVFGYSMVPDMIRANLKAYTVISATNNTIEVIKEMEAE